MALRATAAESQSGLGLFPAAAVDDADGVGDKDVGSSANARRNGEPPPLLLRGEPDSPAVVSSVCGV